MLYLSLLSFFLGSGIAAVVGQIVWAEKKDLKGAQEDEQEGRKQFPPSSLAKQTPRTEILFSLFDTANSVNRNFFSTLLLRKTHRGKFSSTSFNPPSPGKESSIFRWNTAQGIIEIPTPLFYLCKAMKGISNTGFYGSNTMNRISGTLFYTASTPNEISGTRFYLAHTINGISNTGLYLSKTINELFGTLFYQFKTMNGISVYGLVHIEMHQPKFHSPDFTSQNPKREIPFTHFAYQQSHNQPRKFNN